MSRCAPFAETLVRPLDALDALLRELTSREATQAFNALLTGNAFSAAVEADPGSAEALFAAFEAHGPQLVLNMQDRFPGTDGDAFARAVGLHLAAASARAAGSGVGLSPARGRVCLSSNRPDEAGRLGDRAEALLAEISEYEPGWP